MCIELIAKIAHHILTDNIIQIGLPDADQASYNRCHKHNCHIENQPLEIVLADRIVKNGSNHQRVHQSKTSREQDGEQDEDNLQLIRCEGLYNAAYCADISVTPTFLLIF